MPFDYFDHTGDIGVRISAPSREHLFELAAVALSETLTVNEQIEARETAIVEVASAELELLLVDWLSELLYRFDAKGWLTRRAEVAIDDRGPALALRARVFGETLDPARHPVKVLIKAVTYHALRIEETAGQWHAAVVFDI